MNLDKLLPMRYFLIFIKQRIFRFPKFLLKHKFTRHEYFTCYDNIQEIEFPMENLRMLINIRIQFAYLFFDLIHQRIILASPSFIKPSQIFIKFLQQWKQRDSQLIQFLIHFSRDIIIL